MVAGLGHLAKLGTVARVAVGVKELRVVEDVEELGAEVNVFSLRELNRLQDRKIRLTDVRSAADGALGGAEGTKQCRVITSECWRGTAGWLRGIGGILCEAVGIEEIVAVRLRFLSVERCELCRLARQREIEAIHQLIICQRLNLNRESSLKGCDP